MWQRDWHGVHTALNIEWNKHVAEIMNALKGNKPIQLTIVTYK